MRTLIRWWLFGLFGACAAAAGADTSIDPALPESAQRCLDCHAGPDVDHVLDGPHAVAADARTRFASDGCGSCHGPSLEHMQRPPRGQPRARPDHPFSAGSADDAACAGCHRSEVDLHWPGSAHAQAGVGCVGCHRVHQPDPMQAPAQQTARCSECHRTVRAELQRPSTHPLHDGRMQCSDCHAPHGSATPAMLQRATANETCFDCHADLRGPFLWEHPPAREDCSICHRPHGTVHRPLLRQRGPWLCQQCHLAQFHPSTALSGTGLPSAPIGSGSTSLLGRNCMNCHSQVHGSNHPSGPGFTR